MKRKLHYQEEVLNTKILLNLYKTLDFTQERTMTAYIETPGCYKETPLFVLYSRLYAASHLYRSWPPFQSLQKLQGLN